MAANLVQAVEITDDEAEKRATFQLALVTSSVEDVKEAIVSGEYDLHSLLDVALPYTRRHWRDIALNHVLNVGKTAFGRVSVTYKRRLDLLRCLLDYSTVFNKPLSLLRFLYESMDLYPTKSYNEKKMYKTMAVHENAYSDANSLFHVIVASLVKETTWQAIVDIVLSGYHEENITDLQTTADLSQADWLKYSDVIKWRSNSIAVVLLYAKHLLTDQQIVLLTTELKAIPDYTHATQSRGMYTVEDFDQIRVAKVNLKAMYADPDNYVSDDDYQLMELEFFNAREKLRERLCEKEVISTVLGVVGTDLPPYVLQYIVQLAVPCVDDVFGVARLTEIILSAQKLRRIKLGLSEESDYAKRSRNEE
mgnify:CR=1 FL=1